jgi:hypothetical protein
VNTKEDLQIWVQDALRELGGSARIPKIAKAIWQRHRDDLEASGDLFYTWQYDMRWAANRLRRAGIMKSVESSSSGTWELVS